MPLRTFMRPSTCLGSKNTVSTSQTRSTVVNLSFRVFWLTVAGLAFSTLGYATSHLRAGAPARQLPGVMAAGAEYDFFGQGGNLEDDSYRISSLAVFSKVILHIKENYVDPSRINPKGMLKAALKHIAQEIPEVLVKEPSPDQLRLTVLKASKDVNLADVSSLWEINLKLREVFRFLEKTLPPQDDVRNVEVAAVNGALSTLDPHSILLKAEAFREMKTSTRGAFGGLGILIGIRDDQLTIISPMPDTPASRAGLEAGDVIARIGDISTVSMPTDDAVELLRGPEGSEIPLWIMRKGWPEARLYTLKRERIKIQSVESQLLADRVGYVRIKNFQQQTADDMKDQLAAMKKKAGGRLKGLVLDLRNNPGGLMDQAIQVSDHFLSRGEIVTTVGYGDKVRDSKLAEAAQTERSLPIAVLINRGSASASEIVAGALKNQNRAVIIGEQSFGKGSVQVLYDLSNDTALKLTIAQYLTPGDISIQSVGITPDVELKPTWISEHAIRLFYEPEGRRESKLEAHLERSEEAGAPTGKVRYHLPHLLNDQELNPSEPQEPPGFREDFPIRFASKLLLKVGSPSREDMLTRAKSTIQKVKDQEAARLFTKLEKAGVDWTQGPATPQSNRDVKLEVRFHKLGKGSPRRVKAGDKVELEAVITNRGDRAIHRLRGLLQTEHPAFAGSELVFGHLAPGETRRWKVKGNISAATVSRSDAITLELSTDSGKLPIEAALHLITEAAVKPRLAYSWVIDDVERGDGDGVLEMGEGAEMVVTVTNLGEAPAKSVRLLLKSGAKENLFLEKGRAETGTILPGQSQTARLRFKVPSEQHDGGRLPLELTLLDSESGSWLEDELTLHAQEAVKNSYTPKSGGLELTEAAPVHQSSEPQSPILGWLPKRSRLKAIRSLSADGGEAVLVALGHGMQGWLLKPQTRALDKAPDPEVLPTGFWIYPMRSSPRLSLDGDPAAQALDQGRLDLTGVAEGRALKDLFVSVNDEKIDYQIAPQGKAWAQIPGEPPKGDVAKLPFHLAIPLKEGMNKIVVVARQDKRRITYKSLRITYLPKPKTADAAP